MQITTTHAARLAVGRKAVELHPDFESGGTDVGTAAADMIANILHAVVETFGYDEEEIMIRAQYTFDTDDPHND